jgi:pyruvate formate lyase activating enzyme
MMIYSNLPLIRAFNELSEMGDDIFASSIFLGGCNLKCPYCMNSKLARNSTDLIPIDIDIIKKNVNDNSTKWIIITGGEPTCTELNQLICLFKEIKSWGCKIGVSTNGTNSEALREIIGYLDYVAIDIKSAFDKDYSDIGSNNGIIDVIISKSLLTSKKANESSFGYEIRTTLYPVFINRNSIEKIGEIIRKDERWVLQRFRWAKNMLNQKSYEVQPYSEDEIKVLVDVAKKYSDNVVVKYV